jgi:hypothetical protein
VQLKHFADDPVPAMIAFGRYPQSQVEVAAFHRKFDDKQVQEVEEAGTI